MAAAPEYIKRTDRLEAELKSIASGFLFDELSEDYLYTHELDFLRHISLPFRPEDMVAFREGGMTVTQLADNIIRMLGVNPAFPYTNAYIRYLSLIFDEKLIDVITGKGADFLVKEQFHTACCYYRAALVLASHDLKAQFGYACCCREWYLSLEGEDENQALVSILKAESTEYYEWTVLEHPEFAPAYYYLGYAYLNAALYSKAQFVWEKYTELAEKDTQQYKEIQERISDLREPVVIEKGINLLLSGKYGEGLKILEPYTENKRYNSWWPLHYYLGSAYRQLGHIPEAIEGFRNVIRLAPSNYEANEALSQLYEEAGETELAEKYKNKLSLL